MEEGGYQIRDVLPSQNQDNGRITPIPSSAQEQRRARAVKMLKDVMLELALSQSPSLVQSRKKMLAERIDLCLPSLLPSPLHTPSHPPYSLMIITALGKLNNRKGSKQVSISSFIRSNYHDLPLAHEHLLTHHLERLVSRGEVIAVNKSLYALPGGNDNSEKQQQIIVQGEILEGETREDDFGEGVLIALPAVVKPMIPGPGRGRAPGKKIEDKQPHNRSDEVVGPVAMSGFCGGLVSLPVKDPPTLTELQSMSVDVVTGGAPKHSEIVPEAVDTLQKMLPRPGLRRLPEKKIENEHQQNLADSLLMSLTEKHQTALIECDTVNCNDDCGGGAKHLSARIGGVESLPVPGLDQGSFSKDTFKDKKMHNEIVEEKEDDFGGVCMSLSEKHAPSLVEQASIGGDVGTSGGLMSVFEKHAHDMAELKPMGGDDVNGNGLEKSEAINEAVVPLQTEFPRCGRARQTNKKMEDGQPQNRVDEVVGPVDMNGFCGVLVSLSEKDQPTLTKVQSMGGDVVTGCALKHLEAVNPLQKVLPICGLRRVPEKKIENEHQQNKTVEVLGRVHADGFDGRLMSLTEKHPSSLTERDSFNCDDDSGGGAKHFSDGIEEVEPLPGLNRGNSPKHALHDEKRHDNVAEGVESLEEDDIPCGSISLSEKHQQSLVEQASNSGDVGTGGGSKDSLVKAVETLPREKTEVQQQQNEVIDLVEPPDDNDDCGDGSLILVTKKNSPALTKVQSMGGDMHIGDGLKTSAAAPVDLLQKILPVRRSWRHKRKCGDDEQQKEVVNTSEKIPSMPIVDAANNDSKEDLAVENDSQEKQPRRQGRPPKKKRNQKQQEPVSREEDLAVENDSLKKQPRHRGGPPNKKSNRKKQEPVRARRY